MEDTSSSQVQETVSSVTDATEHVDTSDQEVIADEVHVEIMNSHDYGHFRVGLTKHSDGCFTMAEISKLRKQAQRLVDEAIRQYKKAKEEAAKIIAYNPDAVRAQVEHILHIPEDQWSPAMKAAVKAWEDHCYRSRRPYDYEDDWDRGWKDDEREEVSDDGVLAWD